MKHRARYTNETSWAATIAARMPMKESIADEIMAKIHSAFVDLRSGSTDDDLFDRLASTINVGITRAEQIDPLCIPPMLDALIRCDEIHGRHGRYGFDGPGLQAMTTGLEVYEEMLRNSTPQQMRDAMTLSIKRMHRQVADEAKGGA